MAYNAVTSLNALRGSLASIVAYIDNVAHNPVPEGQSSGAEGSNSTEEQKSGTEVQKFKWKPDEQKSEWIRKLESGLDAPGCYNEGDRVDVMKLPEFMRKPEEHYTPQQWLFGLHNRDLQTSTTVASTTESEGLKISLAAACNLKSGRRDKVKPDEVSDNRRDEACDNGWNEFCDKVVPNLDDLVLKSYGLHPNNTAKFSKKEVKSLLTLDALTLLLVLSSLPSPQESFIRWLETGGLKIRALKDGVAYNALWNDLFLFENQIPMELLKNVISKCYLLCKGQNSYSDKELLHKILRNVVCRMCSEIFVEPRSDQKPLSCSINANCPVCSINANCPVGSFEDCAHIFDCVYKILTTFPFEEESSTTTKSLPDEDKGTGVHIFAFVDKILTTFHIKESSTAPISLLDEDKTKGVHKFSFVYKILTTFHFKKESSTATKSLPDEDKTKESASDREQLPHTTSFGNSPKVLDTRETSPDDCEVQMSRIPEAENDLEQPGDCEIQMSRIPDAEHDLEQPGDCEVQMSRIPEAEHDSEQPGNSELLMSRIPEAGFIPPLRSRSRMPVIQNKPGGNLKNRVLADAQTVEKQLCCPQIRTVKKKNLGEKPLGSATDLKKAGLRIKPVSGMIKAVAFKNGCLSLPILKLHDNTESYFRNLAMYEVYGRTGENSNAFSDYLQLMFQLIKTQEDVAYLIDECKVIRNFLVTHQNAFKMWERLQSGIDLDPYSKKFKTDIVIPVNGLCESTPRRMRTEFYNRFCSTPWLAISVITAFLLLLATLIQTYTSVIGSDKMQPHFPRGG